MEDSKNQGVKIWGQVLVEVLPGEVSGNIQQYTVYDYVLHKYHLSIESKYDIGQACVASLLSGNIIAL